MPLDTYRRKRRFGQTPEPRGGPLRRGPRDDGPATIDGRFVVQRHRATRLHYDFRLEIDGVLVSWAIPRGPSLDPKHRRLAVHVEDHPIEYFDFEGVIPNQQYGAGDVIVWDWGRWTADPDTPDAAKALRDGELKLALEGEKLRGAFVIVRMAWSEGGKDQWLLIKRRDDDCRPRLGSRGLPGERQDGAHERRRRRSSALEAHQAGLGELPSAAHADGYAPQMTTAAAILFALVTLGVVAFQLALALGAPWGEFAMGGRYPGTLPRAMRVSAVGQAALLAALAVYVLSAAGLVLPSMAGTLPWLIWAVVAFSALSLVLNAITPSAGERRIWVPVATEMLLTSLIVALGV